MIPTRWTVSRGTTMLQFRPLAGKWWIEWRPKLMMYDVIGFDYLHSIYPRRVLRTDDLFTAVGEVLRRAQA